VVLVPREQTVRSFDAPTWIQYALNARSVLDDMKRHEYALDARSVLDDMKRHDKWDVKLVKKTAGTTHGDTRVRGLT